MDGKFLCGVLQPTCVIRLSAVASLRPAVPHALNIAAVNIGRGHRLKRQRAAVLPTFGSDRESRKHRPRYSEMSAVRQTAVPSDGCTAVLALTIAQSGAECSSSL